MSDLIDRQQAIEKIKVSADDWLISNRTDSYWKGFSMGTHIAIQTIVHEIPSARLKGKWIFNPRDGIEAMFTKPKCSVCGFESADGLNYCPNCGSEMEIE